MDHPENETMEVLVIVAFPELETQASEKAWEEDILNAVAAAVYADKTIDVLAVRPLEHKDCQWVRMGRGTLASSRFPKTRKPGAMICSPCSTT